MKIKFKPTGQEIELNPLETLLQQCVKNGIQIKSVCKGVPSCAECRVHILEGEYNVIPPTAKELQVLGNNYYLDGRRLSCQVRAFGEITVDLSEQIHRIENPSQKMRGFKSKKGGEHRDVTANPSTLVLEENQKKK